MNLSISGTKFNDINGDGFGTRYGPSLTYVPQKHPIMSKDAWNLRTQSIENLPKAEISPEVLAKVSYPSSFSLLSHVPYNASERDQGYCGNCWVWGCTAPIEVANDIQNGVHDRLSIQYFNSRRTFIIHKEKLSPGLIQMPVFRIAGGIVQMVPVYQLAPSQPLQTTR
jgi:hypothetical protein